MPENYFARYLPLLIQVVVASALAGAMVLLSYLLGKRRFSRAKFQPYECGMTPIGDARERFSVKFYLVAMLFILFDVEAVFLYPWAVLLRELKMFGFLEMLVYIGIVAAGLFYVWKKGALDWSRSERPSPSQVAEVSLLDATHPIRPREPELAAAPGGRR
jgi:NADH-quinone oxidoreductase subunit A